MAALIASGCERRDVEASGPPPSLVSRSQSLPHGSDPFGVMTDGAVRAAFSPQGPGEGWHGRASLGGAAGGPASLPGSGGLRSMRLRSHARATAEDAVVEQYSHRQYERTAPEGESHTPPVLLSPRRGSPRPTAVGATVPGAAAGARAGAEEAGVAGAGSVTEAGEAVQQQGGGVGEAAAEAAPPQHALRRGPMSGSTPVHTSARASYLSSERMWAERHTGGTTGAVGMAVIASR